MQLRVRDFTISVGEDSALSSSLELDFSLDMSILYLGIALDQPAIASQAHRGVIEASRDGQDKELEAQRAR